MKGSLDILDKVYQALSTLQVEAYKLEKPLDEKMSEYIVINTLEVPKGELQLCDLNVNIHVTDIDRAKRIPNIKRLKELQGEVEAILDGFEDSEMFLTLKWDLVISEEALPEHYLNLRFDVSVLNNV